MTRCAALAMLAEVDPEQDGHSSGSPEAPKVSRTPTNSIGRTRLGE